MQIIVVTRHLARAAFLYRPVLQALMDADTQLTLLGPGETAQECIELQGLRVHDVAIRPWGERPAPLEWAVLSGALLGVGSADAATVPDVVMTFEEDLASAVSLAGRAARARLVVVAGAGDENPAIDRLAPLVQQWWGHARHALPEGSLHETLVVPLQQVIQPAVEQVLKPALQQVGASPLREALRQRWKEATVRVAQFAQTQPLLHDAIARVTSTATQVKGALHVAAPLAKDALERGTTQMKRYVTGPPIHRLLDESPIEAPASGYTDFRYGVGLDMDAWTASLADPDAVIARPLRIGVWADPWGTTPQHEHLEHTLRAAWVRSSQKEAFTVVAHTNPSSGVDASLITWAQSALESLDIAVVPATDRYAAMQAQAQGVLVVTQAGSEAAQVIRSGETGWELRWLDAVNLGKLLEVLAASTSLSSMKANAQRHAVRQMDTQTWLRRLTRSIDDHLTMAPEAWPPDEEEMGDTDAMSETLSAEEIQALMGRQVRRHI